ncbi:hypothetical protein SLEP1_g3633 [Rubroshorea leprosula]|uniref:Retrotransposon gag domain-containing protein n=1 Tax=Rubroshorea leprosula TaxID=152421 RepID=A0AAV5HVE1_9ROSI|nr:hypothetical protein SLEP1_g3633 [Rubroshorea leprosula]
MIQQNVQFSGLPNENPYSHIASFLEICDTFKANGVSNESVRLTLFLFSLRDKAKSWLQSFPVGHFTIWNVLVDKFIAKFFPPSKTAKLRNDITTFVQFDNESLYEAWERFKELLRQCPNHGLPVWLQVQTFYNALIDVQQGKLSLRIHDEEIVFNVFDAMKNCDHDGSAVLRIDVVDNIVAENFNASRLDDPIDNCIVNALDVKVDSADNNILEAAAILGGKCHRQPQKGGNFLPLDAPSTVTVKPSKEEPPTLELKPLPSQLKYVYLGDSNTLPVIISASLTGIEEEKLLRVLREHKGAIGWSIVDIKGVSPSVCMHKILLEEGHKSVVQPQRRLNPNMQEVVKNEVIKWLDAGIIFPISDSTWVSPVQGGECA